MLIGEYQGKIADKNRVALPKKFRDILGENIIISQGYEGSLIVVSMHLWEQIIKPVASQPYLAGSVRDTTRFIIGSAHEVELDEQGRFIIPQVLREYAEIKNEVSFLGLLRWVEIWDKEKWNGRKEYISKNSTEIANDLNIAVGKLSGDI